MTDHKFVGAMLALLGVALLTIGIAGMFVTPTASGCQSSGPVACPVAPPNYTVADLFLVMGCIAVVPALAIFVPMLLRQGRRVTGQ
jgi:hypothetical protein